MQDMGYPTQLTMPTKIYSTRLTGYPAYPFSTNISYRYFVRVFLVLIFRSNIYRYRYVHQYQSYRISGLSLQYQNILQIFYSSISCVDFQVEYTCKDTGVYISTRVTGYPVYPFSQKLSYRYFARVFLVLICRQDIYVKIQVCT